MPFLRTACARGSLPLVAAAIAALGPWRALGAQTDYMNLDRGRPLRVEDAIPIERHALEVQLAPVTLHGVGGSRRVLTTEPALTWGALPRTQVAVGVRLATIAARGAQRSGLAGVDLSVLHALNVETLTWPALALRAGLQLPAGSLGNTGVLPLLGLVATRTLGASRLHVAADRTWRTGRPARDATDDAARWSAGVALDHTMPLHFLLVGADLVARARPGSPDVEWSSAGGLRLQAGPRLGFDAGVGRTLEAGGEWFLTVGSSLSLAFVMRRPGALR
jgi:hypothetical protein